MDVQDENGMSLLSLTPSSSSTFMSPEPGSAKIKFTLVVSAHIYCIEAGNFGGRKLRGFRAIREILYSGESGSP